MKLSLMASTGCTLVVLFCFVGLYILPIVEAGNNVSYDSRSLIINGERKLLISAAIHYPRSVPAVSISTILKFLFLAQFL